MLYKEINEISEGMREVALEAFDSKFYIYPGGHDYYASDDGKVIGFCTGAIGHTHDFEICLPYEKIGWFGQCAVLKEYSGMGVASKFYEMRIESMKGKVDVIAMSAWKRSDNGYIGIKNLAERFGFKEQYEITNRWLQQSLDDPNYDCKVCKGDVCICSAIVFTLEL